MLCLAAFNTVYAHDEHNRLPKMLLLERQCFSVIPVGASVLSPFQLYLQDLGCMFTQIHNAFSDTSAKNCKHFVYICLFMTPFCIIFCVFILFASVLLSYSKSHPSGTPSRIQCLCGCVTHMLMQERDNALGIFVHEMFGFIQNSETQQCDVNLASLIWFKPLVRAV